MLIYSEIDFIKALKISEHTRKNNAWLFKVYIISSIIEFLL